MCGIAGIIAFDGEPIDAADLSAACDAMRHRGPDDSGTFVDHHEDFAVGLAAVRLAVVDPTPAGHQPLLYDDGRYVVAYNGEVYNHRELRAELKAHGRQFTSNSDTEVVAAACAQWGCDALARFNGMWAFIFFDRKQRHGFLARDRFGIKPLLFVQDGRRLFFASEMTALRRLGRWDRSVDSAALLHYLRFGYFAAPQTVYASAVRLGPAEFLPFDREGPKRADRYPDPAGNSARPCLDYGEACHRTKKALFRAVARRRIADVPLGAFLSGGLDSAVIALHLAECTPGPIKTFSIGYGDQIGYDETRYARRMADHLGSDHHELRVEVDQILDLLPPVLDHLGEPFFDSSILPTAIVSQLARGHVTVCLSGDGGDELFGGYWRYLGHDVIDAYLRLPIWARHSVLEPLLVGGRVSKSSPTDNRLRQFRKLLRARGGDDGRPLGKDAAATNHLAWSQIISPEAEQILRDPQARDRTFRAVLDRMDALCPGQAGDDPLNRILAFDLQYCLPSDMLHKVDLASMYHSLEVRVPFLDPEVVGTALSCPSQFKIRRGRRKRMLIDAYRSTLPDTVLDRAKMGFEVPVGEFLRTRLRDMFLSTVTRERIDSFGLIDFGAVERIYRDHCARRAEHADLLFALLSLCWWRMRGG